MCEAQVRKHGNLKNFCKPTIFMIFAFCATFSIQNAESQLPEDTPEQNTLCIWTHDQRIGVGFVLNGEGEFITPYHILKGLKGWSRINLDSPYHERTFGADLEDYWKGIKEDDVALLKLTKKEASDFRFNDVIIVDSLRNEYKGQPALAWRGCDRIGFTRGTIGTFKGKKPPRKIWVTDFSEFQKGNSGTPIFLRADTGWALIGILEKPAGGGDLSEYFPVYQLISGETISALLTKGNPGNLPAEAVEFEQERIDSNSVDSIYQELNASENFLRSIIERRAFLFENKEQVDQTIYAFFEAKSFVRTMRQRKSTLTKNRVLAIRLYMKGLETKAIKKNGFKEALEYFGMAVEVNPSFAEPKYQLGLYYLARADSAEKARANLTAALQDDPENYEVLRSLTVFYLRNAQFDTAYDYLTKITKIDSLLAENDTTAMDPRIPLYWAVFYDPTWYGEKRSEKREPDFGKARTYYIRSLELQPFFITPANNLVWTFLTQLEQDTLGQLNKGVREGLIDNLRNGLRTLQPFVEWGFNDPRVVETFAHAYAYLSKIGSDQKLKKEDCSRACEYVSLIENVLPEVELSRLDARAIEAGLQYVRSICKCEVTHKR